MTTPPQGPPEWYGYEDDEPFDLRAQIQTWRGYAQIIWGERRFVAKVVAISVALGLVIAFGSQPEYTASTKILPYRASGTGSGLSGLAGLAGVRLPQGAGDQTITADLYPEVAKTLDFRVAVAETPIRFSSLPEPVTQMRYFREIARPSVVDVLARYSFGLPRTILSAFRPKAPVEPLPGAESGPAIEFYDSEYRDVLKRLERRLTVTSDKKTFIITITGRMPDRFAAADLVRTASDRLMATIIEYEAKKAAEQLSYVEEQAAKAQSRLDRIQREQALLADRTRGTMSATAQLTNQRLQREYSQALEVYTRLGTELEQARLKKSQDTPVFAVLEKVVVPDRRATPRRSLMLIIAASLGFALSLGLIGIKTSLLQL